VSATLQEDTGPGSSSGAGIKELIGPVAFSSSRGALLVGDIMSRLVGDECGEEGTPIGIVFVRGYNKRCIGSLRRIQERVHEVLPASLKQGTLCVSAGMDSKNPAKRYYCVMGQFKETASCYDDAQVWINASKVLVLALQAVIPQLVDHRLLDTKSAMLISTAAQGGTGQGSQIHCDRLASPAETLGGFNGRIPAVDSNLKPIPLSIDLAVDDTALLYSFPRSVGPDSNGAAETPILAEFEPGVFALFTGFHAHAGATYPEVNRRMHLYVTPKEHETSHFGEGNSVHKGTDGDLKSAIGGAPYASDCRPLRFTIS